MGNEIPKCESCSTAIGWTKAINGDKLCGRCQLDKARDEQGLPPVTLMPLSSR